jgi:hypothetical protein
MWRTPKAKAMGAQKGTDSTYGENVFLEKPLGRKATADDL